MHGAGRLHNLNAWENRSTKCASRMIATGLSALDELLPDGGWPRAGMVEVTESGDRAAALGLFIPALARISRQGRGIVLVAPPYAARKQVFTATAVKPVAVIQVNPHPGRSALWTVESLLQSGQHGVVMAWQGCDTELMEKRLQKAALQGRGLCVLFRQPCRKRRFPGSSVRLGVDSDEAGRSVYLVNDRGERLAGAAWD